MLAPGRAAIHKSIWFRESTTYINRYAREGINKTTSERYRIRVAAGITTRLVNRK
jgi:hypothetical protein